MADYTAGHPDPVLTAPLSGGTDGPTTPTALDGVLVPGTAPALGVYEDTLNEPHAVNDFVTEEFDAGPGQFWFERIHYTPAVIELGNLLSTVTVEAELYSSHRSADVTVSAATNNAGAGITFDGLPTPPFDLSPQEGVIYDVVVSIDGPPTINGTLDYETDLGDFSIDVTGSRVVMFAYEPERGIVERLEWKTDILRSADGTEQRVSWRKNPRQLIEMKVLSPEGSERRKMMSLLKGWHTRVFGVPIWWESRTLQADASAGATTVSVDTAYADYRVDGLVIVWSDSDTFDAIQISAVNANSLELASPINNSYTGGQALVMPLRTAHLGTEIPVKRFLNALEEVPLSWRVLDNDVGDSFGDTTPFSTHNSKVMLDDFNVADSGGIPDGLTVRVFDLDNEIGSVSRYSDWLADTVVTQKGFYGGTRQAIWEARRLGHALRGSQTSFYLPTFYYDLIVKEDLTSASTLMDIEHIGYTDYVFGAEPFVSIWIELNDGTILTREVTDAEVVDSDTERLTVGTAWASDVSKDDIARVSLLRRVRIADDAMEFVHDLPGSAEIKMNVRGAS